MVALAIIAVATATQPAEENKDLQADESAFLRVGLGYGGWPYYSNEYYPRYYSGARYYSGGWPSTYGYRRSFYL